MSCFDLLSPPYTTKPPSIRVYSHARTIDVKENISPWKREQKDLENELEPGKRSQASPDGTCSLVAFGISSPKIRGAEAKIVIMFFGVSWSVRNNVSKREMNP